MRPRRRLPVMTRMDGQSGRDDAGGEIGRRHVEHQPLPEHVEAAVPSAKEEEDHVQKDHPQRAHRRQAVEAHGAVEADAARNDLEAAGCGELHHEHRQRRDAGGPRQNGVDRRGIEAAAQRCEEDGACRQDQVEGRERSARESPWSRLCGSCHVFPCSIRCRATVMHIGSPMCRGIVAGEARQVNVTRRAGRREPSQGMGVPLHLSQGVSDGRPRECLCPFCFGGVRMVRSSDDLLRCARPALHLGADGTLFRLFQHLAGARQHRRDADYLPDGVHPAECAVCAIPAPSRPSSTN